MLCLLVSGFVGQSRVNECARHRGVDYAVSCVRFPLYPVSEHCAVLMDNCRIRNYLVAVELLTLKPPLRMGFEGSLVERLAHGDGRSTKSWARGGWSRLRFRNNHTCSFKTI